VLKFQVRLLNPSSLPLEEFLCYANHLVERLPGRDVSNWANLGFLMVDHDFNINVRIGYDDVLLNNYLLSLVGDGNDKDKKHLKVKRSA
jgi:hypothetical protein